MNWKAKSPLYCGHANEAPAICTCPSDCYCRVEGNCPDTAVTIEQPIDAHVTRVSVSSSPDGAMELAIGIRIAQEIKEAVAAERERCARICERMFADGAKSTTARDLAHAATCSAAECIRDPKVNP